MQSKASVFIGGGFSEGKLLWLFPVVDSFCKQKQISRILLERPLSPELKSIPHIQEVFERYEVSYLRSESRTFARFQHVIWIALALSNLYLLFQLAFGVSRAMLLQRQERYRSQLLHAVWDSACLNLEDGSIAPSSFTKLVESARVLLAVRQATYAVRKRGVQTAFLGHIVYHSRGTFAALQSLGVQVFAHAQGVLYECPAEKDTSWSAPSQAVWDKIRSLFSDSEVQQYWHGRTTGRSTYADSQTAALGTKQVGNSTPKNLLLLHVFRDSPFNQIDDFRIFADYVDWISNTLPAIAQSEETWMVKIHPTARRWGENQQTWLTEICKFALGSSELPANTVIGGSEYSNMNLFQHANRLVTFGGTAHLEAACWGIKPIVMMDVGLAALDPSAVLVPRSREFYYSLLSAPSDSADFRLSEAQIALARSLLFARENVLDMGASVGQIPLYRGDSMEQGVAEFQSVLRTSVYRKRELAVLGEQLARGSHRSVSLQYVDQWSKLFDGGQSYGPQPGPMQ